MLQRTSRRLAMDIEDSIVSKDAASVYQANILSMLTMPRVEEVAAFIGGGSSSEDRISIAKSIIDNRHKFYGYKDFMYCFYNMLVIDKLGERRKGIDVATETICKYVLEVRHSSLERLQLLIVLLYSPVLVSVAGMKQYLWKYFDRGVWVSIDVAQVSSMIVQRLNSMPVDRYLNIPYSDSNKLYEKACKGVFSGIVCSQLYVGGFKEECDNKDKVFCMPSMTYDLEHTIIRKGLPSDRSTLRSSYDVNFNTWTSRKESMLKVLCEWMYTMDVVDNYLDILAQALGMFPHRYSIVNAGSGSDGKSTWIHILKGIYSGYAAVLPTKATAMETNNANDATPVANRMVSKRLCYVTDVKNMSSIISSPAFKSISGGDEAYLRAMHQEAAEYTPSLKCLVIFNTNDSQIVLTNLSELTRIKVFKWDSKTIDTSDIPIIPMHQVGSYKEGVEGFHTKFLEMYGEVFMTELICRHSALKRSGNKVHLSKTVLNWTRDIVSPKTILIFLDACTENIASIDKDKQPEDETAIDIYNYSSEIEQDVTVSRLFFEYQQWRKLGNKYSNTDPNSIETFTSHLEFYHIVHTKYDSYNNRVKYVSGISIKNKQNLMYFRNSSGRIVEDIEDISYSMSTFKPITARSNPIVHSPSVYSQGTNR